MDKLAQHQLTTSRSLTYNYYTHTPNPTNDKPTLVFLHGWPDDAFLWQKVIPPFLSLPFNIIIPDLLGFGASSKPADKESYNYHHIARDIMEIADHHQVEKIIPIGHDFGSAITQRIWFTNPARCAAIILMNVAYMPPDLAARRPFDLDAALAAGEKMLGYPNLAYWQLFTAPDAPELMAAHADALWAALHGAPDDWMRSIFCRRGAIRDFLLAGQHVPLKPYAQDPALKAHYVDKWKAGEFQSSLNYYRATRSNVFFDDDMSLKPEDLVITVPTLFIGCTKDAVCRAEAIRLPQALGLLPDLRVESIDAAHWVQQEKPEEVSRLIIDFLTARFGAEGGKL